MNMEMCICGDFGQQAGVHNCAIIHPQSLKFWECDLHCDRSAQRASERLADCVCVWWPWTYPISVGKGETKEDCYAMPLSVPSCPFVCTV